MADYQASPDPYIDALLADRYLIQRRLAEGGMGVVYLAEHALIGRPVALKLLSPELSRDAEGMRRFLQEARVTAGLRHENIVEMYDFCRTEECAFLVMEYLEGRDLADTLREDGPLPPARVRPILRQVCGALAAAHGAGVVHGDLKPENIFLARRPGRGDRVKILDFGVAQAVAAPGTPQDDEVRGTPEYMSPEQVRGEPLSASADIYSLGCILYEMLTGAPPFTGDPDAVLDAQLGEAPAPPGERAPVPEDLGRLCLRALAKDPAERPPSMDALLLMLTPLRSAWRRRARR